MSMIDPVSIFLASSGSRGDRLLFRYPYESDDVSKTSFKCIRNNFAVRINEDQRRQTWHSSSITSQDLIRYNDEVIGHLLAVKPDLCDQNFEVKVNNVVFVGFPVSLQNSCLNEPPVKRESVSCVSFHIAFALKGGVDKITIQSYHDLTKQLATALKYEQQRCSYLSKQKYLMWSIQDEIATFPEDSRESPYAVMLQKSSLAKKFKSVFDNLCNSGIVQLHINKWIQVSFCIPHKVHTLALPDDVNCKIKPDDIQKCISSLRPYHGMLLLVSESALIRSLPVDGSPAITRLISVASPLKSLYQLASDADLSLGQVYKLVIHLVYWGKATVIFPLCETNVYILARNANTCVNSSLVEKFVSEFPGMSLPVIMSEFSLPTPLGEHRDVHGLPQQQAKQVQMVIWLLKHRLLIQLHTYVFLMTKNGIEHAHSKISNESSSGKLIPINNHIDKKSKRFSSGRCTSSDSNIPKCLGETSVISEENETFESYSEQTPSLEITSDGSVITEKSRVQKSIQKSVLSFLSEEQRDPILSVKAAENIEDLKLFARLCPYFNGKRHMEDIMYYENLHRSQLLTLMDKFREVLVTSHHEDPGITIWTSVNQT